MDSASGGSNCPKMYSIFCSVRNANDSYCALKTAHAEDFVLTKGCFERNKMKFGTAVFASFEIL
jgi:hypothetical protein